ncbi:MAG: hypothetical protein Q9217_006859 [Psora testacea]
MDLVAGVRKEGSRGGRANFKWEDVKDDAHRENYLAVGRWQKGRDLSWYAKSDTSPAALSAAEARKEELRKIKEAEQDALSEALGYGPMPKRNANETPLGKKEVERAIRETAEGDELEVVKGVGFGTFGPRNGDAGGQSEVLSGVGMEDQTSIVAVPTGNERPKKKKRSSKSRERYRHRRHERSRSRDQKHKRHGYRNEEYDRRYSSQERRGEKYGHHRQRSRSYESRRYDGPHHERRRDRSGSPRHYKRRYQSRDRNYDS